jgi:hypothetical protein
VFESEDAVTLLAFWKDYLEENDLANFIPQDELH